MGQCGPFCRAVFAAFTVFAAILPLPPPLPLPRRRRDVAASLWLCRGSHYEYSSMKIDRSFFQTSFYRLRCAPRFPHIPMATDGKRSLEHDAPPAKRQRYRSWRHKEKLQNNVILI